jgi:hypothetical protein
MCIILITVSFSLSNFTLPIACITPFSTKECFKVRYFKGITLCKKITFQVLKTNLFLIAEHFEKTYLVMINYHFF